MITIHIRAGRVQPLWAGHPWVFAQAIERIDGSPGPGEEVKVVGPKGESLGRGFYSPESAIPVRLATSDVHQTLDAAWFEAQIKSAFERRKRYHDLPNPQTTGYRLIHSDGDWLPGLVADVFDDTLVVQLLTIGMKQREDLIFSALMHVTGAKHILEVAVPSIQKIEGFEVTPQTVRGPDVTSLNFKENGFVYELDISKTHQKTGFYFDQREHRHMLSRLSEGKRVLDVCAYVGSFAMAAARGGATQVVAVESSASVVALGALTAQHNGLGSKIGFQCADAKKDLRTRVEKGEHYDIVVLDPPKLVPTVKHLERGRKMYRELNAQALRLLSTGGMLLTCSCSSAMRSDDFVRMLAMSARDAHRDIVVERVTQQAPDHPVRPAFTEGHYLKAAWVRVIR